MKKLIAAVAIAASAMAANARSLLYYYDFDKVGNAAIWYIIGENHGSKTPRFLLPFYYH